jgi:shikimate 5-dehydrogenase
LEALPSDWKTKGDLYLFRPDATEALISQFERLPDETRAAQGFDCLVRLQNQWWPRLYTKSALKFMIVKSTPLLNTQGVAYVTGIGAQARAAMAVLLEMGFGRLRVVWPEKADTEKVLQQVRSRYFSIDVQWLADEELTLQPNNGSLLINTRDHSDSQTLVDDLSYLNFLQKDGLVVEFWSGRGLNRILQEAQNIGQKIVTPAEIDTAIDAHLWADLLSVAPGQNQSQFVFWWYDQLKASKP